MSKSQVTGGGNRFRYQVMDPDFSRSLCQQMDQCMEGHGLQLGARRARKPYVLNTEDAADPCNALQAAHCDYNASRIAGVVGDADRVPLSCVWAVSQKFELAVCPQGPHGPSVHVPVPAGHMIVFRGDLWHGGGRHMNAAFRVHGYVAEPNTYIPDFVYH